MIDRESISIGVWSSCAVNDVTGVFTEGVAWRIECEIEVIYSSVGHVSCGSFEAAWKVGENPVSVEGCEKVVPRRRDVARVEAPCR